MTKIQEIQTIIGVEPDGIFGPISEAALQAIIHPKVVTATPLASERSERNIATLLAPVQEKARQLVALAESSGVHIEIISGTRTYAEQDVFFAQGGVTKARGGQSAHNHGIAFDFGVFHEGRYIEESPDYAKVGKLGKSIGLSWGGDWESFEDAPHFELRPDWSVGMSEAEMMANLRSRHDSGTPVFS